MRCNLELEGYLSGDPEQKTTKNGKVYAKFSIPVKSGKGEWENTTWFNCKAYSQTAEYILENCKKGDILKVNRSSIECRKWEDEGVKKEFWGVTVWECEKGSKEEKKVGDIPF